MPQHMISSTSPTTSNMTHRRFKYLGSVANICSTTIGAGVVSLPRTYQKCGLIGGVILMCVSAFLTAVSLVILSMAIDQASKRAMIDNSSSPNNGIISSYVGLTFRVCGRRTGHLVEIAVILMCFGVMVAFLIALGDIIEDGIIKEFDLSLSRDIAIEFFCLFCMLPLSLLRNVDSLKYSSTFGVVAVMFFVIVTIGKSIQSLIEEGYNTDGEVKLFPDSLKDVMQACPVALNAFASHHIIPRIYYELQDDHNVSRMQQMKEIVNISVPITAILYITMGAFAYVEFGDGTQGDVLKNFCIQDTHDQIVIAAFVLLSFKICAAFPLQMFPCRDSVLFLLTRCMLQSGSECCENGISNDRVTSNDKTSPLLDNEVMIIDPLNGALKYDGISDNVSLAVDDSAATSLARHVLLTLGITLSALLLAVAIPDISVVFGILGSTCVPFICYIMPPIFLLKLDPEAGALIKRCLWCFVAGGASLGFLGTYFVIEGLLVEKEDTNDYCES